MTQSALGTSTNDAQKKIKLYTCDWSNCEGKHTKEIKYPNKGKIKKSGYRDKWIAAGMQPWDLYGEINKRYSELGNVYKSEVYTYQTEGHHIVPTCLLDKTSTLKNNLVLINYNCDDVVNGVMLPKHETDIPLHDLQSHLGNHPNKYMKPIQDKLLQFEEDFDGICNEDISCNMSFQANLKSLIESLSNTVRSKILNIRKGKDFLPVRTNALQEYKDAHKEYNRRLALNKNK